MERGPEAVLGPKCLPKVEKTLPVVIITLLRFLEMPGRECVALDSTQNTADQLEG